MKFKLQSLNDVVTNSSMEVYQEATEYTVDAVKEIINVILKISGSDKSCDDLFTVCINYEDMLCRYFDYYLEDSDLDEEYKGMIESALDNNYDKVGYSKYRRATYQELVDKGLVGDVMQTIEEFTSSYDSDYSYAETEVSIVPKGEASQSDIDTLNQINSLFNVEACYNS